MKNQGNKITEFVSQLEQIKDFLQDVNLETEILPFLNEKESNVLFELLSGEDISFSYSSSHMLFILNQIREVKASREMLIKKYDSLDNILFMREILNDKEKQMLDAIIFNEFIGKDLSLLQVSNAFINTTGSGVTIVNKFDEFIERKHSIDSLIEEAGGFDRVKTEIFDKLTEEEQYIFIENVISYTPEPIKTIVSKFHRSYDFVSDKINYINNLLNKLAGRDHGPEVVVKNNNKSIKKRQNFASQIGIEFLLGDFYQTLTPYYQSVLKEIFIDGMSIADFAKKYNKTPNKVRLNLVYLKERIAEYQQILQDFEDKKNKGEIASSMTALEYYFTLHPNNLYLKEKNRRSLLAKFDRNFLLEEFGKTLPNYYLNILLNVMLNEVDEETYAKSAGITTDTVNKIVCEIIKKLKAYVALKEEYEELVKAHTEGIPETFKEYYESLLRATKNASRHELALGRRKEWVESVGEKFLVEEFSKTLTPLLRSILMDVIIGGESDDEFAKKINRPKKYVKIYINTIKKKVIEYLEFKQDYSERKAAGEEGLPDSALESFMHSKNRKMHVKKSNKFRDRLISRYGLEFLKVNIRNLLNETHKKYFDNVIFGDMTNFDFIEHFGEKPKPKSICLSIKSKINRYYAIKLEYERIYGDNPQGDVPSLEEFYKTKTAKIVVKKVKTKPIKITRADKFVAKYGREFLLDEFGISLTKRQQEILQHVMIDGMNAKEFCEQFGVKSSTIYNYTRVIKSKLSCYEKRKEQIDEWIAAAGGIERVQSELIDTLTDFEKDVFLNIVVAYFPKTKTSIFKKYKVDHGKVDNIVANLTEKLNSMTSDGQVKHQIQREEHSPKTKE